MKKAIIIILYTTLMMTAAQESQVIDLTKPYRGRSSGAPGVSYGSNPLGLIGPKSYRLPLSVRIRKVAIGSDDDVIVDVEVRNHGPEVVSLPISIDPVVHRDGNKGRRTWLVRFYVRRGLKEESKHIVASTFGSVNETRSLFQLPPNKEVVLRIAGRLPALERVPNEEGDSEILVQVGCFEWRIEDESYMIESESVEIRSPEFGVSRPAAK